MNAERITVWKHDCNSDPCDPCVTKCDDPWQVDAPYPYGATFDTHNDAIRYADRVKRQLMHDELEAAVNELVAAVEATAWREPSPLAPLTWLEHPIKVERP